MSFLVQLKNLSLSSWWSWDKPLNQLGTQMKYRKCVVKARTLFSQRMEWKNRRRRVKSCSKLEWLEEMIELATIEHLWSHLETSQESGRICGNVALANCVKFLLVCSSIYSLGASISTLGSWSNGCIQTSLDALNLTLGSWSSGGVQIMMG